MSHHQPKKDRYRVQIGETSVTVESDSREGAIRLARFKLADDMPRLWDMIFRIADGQFRVDLAHG